MRFLLVLLAAVGSFCAVGLSVEPENDTMSRAALEKQTRAGFELLNKLYWSPTLKIWLDRAGDDLRAHYEGRRNPPWWSSANAVETMLDFMQATGTADQQPAIEALYEMQREPDRKRAPLVAELKRRGQWSDADEQAEQRRRQKAEARRDQPAATSHYYSEFCNEYLDDSGWWGIAWLKMYDRTRAPKYLATAKTIHAHMAKNWRPDKAGGVMWCEDPDKLHPNSITNSLFMILSARLYRRTHEAAYLDWAERTLAWMREQKLYDGIAVVDTPGHQGDYWTYNQGAYLGGLTALYEATGRQEYLDEAAKVAETMLTLAGLVRSDGVIFEKLGTSGWDPGLFKGVMVRYLGQSRDVLRARKLHPETAAQIDGCIRASVASMLQHSVGPDRQFTIEWYEGAKDQTHNFNTQISALAALVAAMQ